MTSTTERHVQEARAKAREVDYREQGAMVSPDATDNINDRLDVLGHIQNDLSETIGVLKNRLRPILDPRVGMEVDDSPKFSEPTNLSPLAHRIEILRNNLRDDLRNLQEIINAVDL